MRVSRSLVKVKRLLQTTLSREFAPKAMNEEQIQRKLKQKILFVVSEKEEQLLTVLRRASECYSTPWADPTVVGWAY